MMGMIKYYMMNNLTAVLLLFSTKRITYQPAHSFTQHSPHSNPGVPLIDEENDIYCILYKFKLYVIRNPLEIINYVK